MPILKSLQADLFEDLKEEETVETEEAPTPDVIEEPAGIATQSQGPEPESVSGVDENYKRTYSSWAEAEADFLKNPDEITEVIEQGADRNVIIGRKLRSRKKLSPLDTIGYDDIDMLEHADKYSFGNAEGPSAPSGFNFHNLVHGLSLGTVGEEPDDWAGLGTSILGEMLVWTGATIMTEGMAAGALGHTVTKFPRVARLFGNAGAIATGATGRAALNLPGRMAVAGTGGFLADEAIYQITPEEESLWWHLGGPMLAGVFPAVTHGIGKAIGKGTVNTVSEKGGKLVEDARVDVGEIGEVEFNQVFKGMDEDEAAQFIQANFPATEDAFDVETLSKAWGRELTPSEASGVRTRLERDIVMYGKLSKEYIKAEAESKVNYLVDRAKFLYGGSKKGKSFYFDRATKAVAKAFDEFAEEIGGYVTPGQQGSLFESLKNFRGLGNDVEIKNINRLIDEGKIILGADSLPISFKDGRRKAIPKGGLDMDITKQLRTLAAKIQHIEMTAKYGLPPKASPKRVLEKTQKYLKHLDELETKYAQNPKTEEIIATTNKVLDSLVSNPLKVLSPSFAKSASMIEFTRAVALFKGRGNPHGRTAEAEKLLEQLLKDDKNFNRRITQLTKEARKTNYNEKQQAEVLHRIMGSSEDINPKQFTGLRQVLVNIIKDQIREMPQDLVNLAIKQSDQADQLKQFKHMREQYVSIGKQQMGLTEDMAKEMELLVDQQKQLYDNIAQELLKDPTLARSVADSLGNKQLTRALDTVFASLGDPVAIMRIQGDQMLGHNAVAKAIVRNRLIARPLPSLESSIDDLFDNTKRIDDIDTTKLTSDPGVIPTRDVDGVGNNNADIPKNMKPDDGMPELFDTTQHDVNKWDQALKTPRQVFQKYGALAEGRLKEVFKSGEKWVDRMFDRRTEYLRFLDEKLNPAIAGLKASVDELGKEGTTAIHYIEDLGRRADVLLDEKKMAPDAVRDLIRKDVARQSATTQKIYKQYKAIQELIRDEVNAGIDRYNRRVANGEIRGEVRSHLRDRPGWNPFVYEGDYAIRLITHDGQVIPMGYVFGTEGAYAHIKGLFKGQLNVGSALKKTVKEYAEGNLKGKIVLEPRFIDQAEDLISITALGRGLDDTFGVNTDHLVKMLDEGTFTPDTVHNTFYGHKKHRLLAIDEKNLKKGFYQSLEVAGRVGKRHSAYIDIAVEGQQLSSMFRQHRLPRAADFVKVMGNDLLGVSRDMEKIVDGYINGIMDVLFKVPGSSGILRQVGLVPNGRSTRAIIHGLTTLSRLTTLGFNASTAIVNMAIIPTNVAPIVGMGNTLRAMKKIGSILRKNDPDLLRLLKKGQVTVRHSGSAYHDPKNLAQFTAAKGEQFMNQLDNWSMYGFNKTEDIARGVTLLAARDHAQQMAARMLKTGRGPKRNTERLLKEIADQKGLRIDHMDVAEEYAVRIMKETNFDYDLTGLSELARNPLAKPFMQFKTYFTKELEFLFGKEGIGLDTKQKLWALSAFTAIGGTLALPGVEEIDQVTQAITGFSPKMWAKMNMPELMAGGIGAIAGIDFSSRINVGSFTYAFNPRNFAGAGAYKAYRAINMIMSGQHDLRDSTFGQISTVKAMMDAHEIATTGALRDNYGDKVSGREDFTDLQLMARALGFKSQREGDAMLINRQVRNDAENMRSQISAGYNKMYKADEDGDLREYKRLKKKLEITDKEFKRWKEHKDKSQQERWMNRTNTRSKDKTQEMVDWFEKRHGG